MLHKQKTSKTRKKQKKIKTKTQTEAEVVNNAEENTPNREINVIIEEGAILTHVINPEVITNDNAEIKLKLKQAPEKTKSFYIHEVGKENNDPLAQFSVKKGVDEETEDFDFDEVEDKPTFTIALYEKEHDTQIISNKLQISIPGTHISFFSFFSLN